MRPARKPREGCLCLLTAVLLNKRDYLLLQGTMRLSGSTYTVGGGLGGGGHTRPYGTRPGPAGGHIGPPLLPPAKHNPHPALLT